MLGIGHPNNAYGWGRLDVKAAQDIDGNPLTEPLTDGLMIIRYLFGIRGQGLIQGAIRQGSARATASDVELFLQALTP